MRHSLSLWILPVLGLAFAEGAADAQVIIRAPFVRVSVGPPSYPVVGLPVGYRVNNAQTAVQTAPAPIVSTPAPAIQVVPLSGEIAPVPQPLAIAPPRPLTLQEFAKVFVPVPGIHEVVLLHPVKNTPMTAVFTLPAGNPVVRVTKREIVFDYGKRHEVQIRFPLGGSVRVESR